MPHFVDVVLATTFGNILPHIHHLPPSRCSSNRDVCVCVCVCVCVGVGVGVWVCMKLVFIILYLNHTIGYSKCYALSLYVQYQ
jgi:hypothetical protein